MKEQVKRLECAEQALIDRYLLGELNAEDRKWFEKKMKEDSAFRESVSLQNDLMAGILMANADTGHALDKDISQKGNKNIVRYLAKISAVILFVIAGSIFFSKDSNIEQQAGTEQISQGIEYPAEWAFGDVDFVELAALNNISLFLDKDILMLNEHFFEFHNAIPN
ncbi:MAG: hypothetical protein AAF502_04115 [Bacteroidota bacterium]